MPDASLLSGLVLLTAAAVFLAACGSDPAPPPAEGAQPAAATELSPAQAAPGGSDAAPAPAAARTSPAAQTPAVDIVGLRLGMTPDEALAALEAFDPVMNLRLVEDVFRYNDGVSHFQSDSFLAEIRGTLKGSRLGDDFILLFTPPPNGGRLWLVDRREDIRSNPPSMAQYTEALREKYGEPTVASAEGMELGWEFPAGAPTCLRERPTSPHLNWRPRATHISGMFNGVRYLQDRGRAPADLSTCAPQLYVNLGGDPVRNLNAILIDVAAFFAANDAANAFRDALEADARRQREASGQAPRL